MASIPANLGRVPNLLASQLLLSSISKTNVGLLNVQSQMASGKKITRFSDDAIAASAVSVLLDRLKVGNQTLANLTSADNAVSYLDSSVGDATDLVREAKSIASSQIGVTSDAATRGNQAVVIDGMIRQLYQLANRSSNGVYIFGGSTATRPPIEELRGGFRYTGYGSGLLAQLGPASDVPITLGGENAIGETSVRVRGTVDLNPNLTGGTRLSDVRGARGLGIARGSIAFSFDGGPTATVDLSQADTAQDVVNALRSAIQQYESDNSVTILGPGGVSLSSGGAISIDVVAGSPPPNPALTFTEIGSGTTGGDLGLTQAAFDAADALGADTNPRLTLQTPVSALAAVNDPLGTVRFRFTSAGGSSSTDVDLSSAQTIDDVRSLIESRVPGVRVQINAAGTGIDVVSEIAGPSLAIEPVGTLPDTATELGIRSLVAGTRLTEFNDGRGVRIVDNAVDPVSGIATRAFNTDFRITLGNGQAFDVDLRPQDMTDVQALLARINDEFATAVGQPPINASAPALAAGQFVAALPSSGNGLALTQIGITGGIKVDKQNNSAAADDLGLLVGSYDATSATLTSQDRATVRVNNIFTALIRLRDALRADDSSGITVAGSELDAQVDRLAQTQALVGVFGNRIQSATRRVEDEQVLSEKVRSQLQDLDYSEASIRFNLLQTQLQAALQTGGRSQSLTLLDFLG